MLRFRWRAVLLVLGLVITGTSAIAQNATPAGQNKVEAFREQGYSVRSISPIFSQLVVFSLPKGFTTTAFESTKGSSYIRESVLPGESVEKWSQMVTVTGAKGLASNPNITPQIFAARMADGIKNVCPTSFAAVGLGAFKIGNYDAFAAITGCGIVQPIDKPYSETTLLIIIKGESDYYSIQWAERGASSPTPMKYDQEKWVGRLKTLAPFKLCPIVPGEPAPYPSCVGGKLLGGTA